MKILHLSIITGSSIVGLIIFAIILLNFNSQQLRIEGVNDTYKIGDIINATVFYNKQQSPCNYPKMELRNATNQSQVIWGNPGGTFLDTDCRDNWQTEFYAGMNGNSVINHTQSYVIYAALGNKQVEKEFTVYPDPSRKYYTDIQVSDPNPIPQAGVPFGFKITITGHGIFDAGQSPYVLITDNVNSTVWHSRTDMVLCCPSEMSYYNFTIDTSTRWNPIILNKSGTYQIQVSYNDKTVEKKFTVLPVMINYSKALPYFIKVDDSNFTINYNIFHGEISKIRQDAQSQALIISMQSPQNGTLTIDIPRKLIDAHNANKVDEQFIVLTDGQETGSQEINTTVTDRTLSIPFKQGTQEIEIIATQII